MGRASRRKAGFSPPVTLHSTGLDKPVPRPVERIFPRKPLFTWSAAAWLLVCGIVTFSIAGSSVIARLAATTFGYETTAKAISAGTEKNLKGTSREILQFAWQDQDGVRRVGTYPVGFGTLNRLKKQQQEEGQAALQVTVAYLPFAPSISGLVDDYGYSRFLLQTMLAVCLVMLALIFGEAWYIRTISDPAAFHLYAEGIPVPVELGTARFDAQAISYTFGGKTYRKRLRKSKIWSATRFTDGYIALVDPQRPSRFILHGNGPVCIRT